MLSRKITLSNGIVIAMAMIVGSGLFGLPGLAIQATDPMTALAGWGMMILLMPALIQIFSYLGQRYPSTEGLSLYASIGLGQWSRNGVMLVTCGTLAIGMPSFFLVGGSYIAKLLGLDADIWMTPCAVLLAIVTTVINLLGLEKLSALNKLVVLLIFATIGFILFFSLPSTVDQYRTLDFQAIDHVTLSGAWLAASIVFWAFQGWESLTFGFGEIENPQRNIPLIFWLSFVLVILIYVIFAAVVSAAALDGKDVAGLAGVANILPPGIPGKFFLVVMVLVLIANANSWVFGCSRAFYSAARVGVLPHYLAKISQHGTLANCLKSSLLMYVLVMLAMSALHIKEQYAFMLTTQGFILLYGGAIIAFFRISTGIFNRLVGIAAIISWIFLIHGFGWMTLYPLALFIIGTFVKKQSIPSQL